ncbi:MAG: cytochrome c [Acidocella sp.]|nr:cytochrome c [Acidocella sp.]
MAASAGAATPPALYTDAQATAGSTVFSDNCAMCHGADLTGAAGPALIGQAFAAPGSNYTVGAIFSEIAEQMPAGQPGSLSQTQYEQVMAYILKENGFPSGSTALNYKASLASTVPLVSQVK